VPRRSLRTLDVHINIWPNGSKPLIVLPGLYHKNKQKLWALADESSLLPWDDPTDSGRWVQILIAGDEAAIVSARKALYVSCP